MPKAIKKFSQAADAATASQQIEEASKKRQQIAVEISSELDVHEIVAALDKLSAPEKCVICLQVLSKIPAAYSLAVFNRIVQGKVSVPFRDSEDEDDDSPIEF